MIRLKDTKHPTTASLFTEAIGIAEHFGFAPLEQLPKYAQNARPRKANSARDTALNFARRDERSLVGSMRKCLARVPVRVNPDNTHVREPLLAWHITHGSQPIPSQNLELHVVGSPLAVAETLLITVAQTIAREAGIARTVLCVNNLGSSDSSTRFVRDVGSYLRKHIESISPTLHQRIADDPLGTLVQLIERRHPAISRAPQPMEYLTEDERRRFWELLEYLEVSGSPYELSGHVLGSRDVWAHSLFEIYSLDEETGSRISIAQGGRSDPLSSSLAGRHTPSAVITISCEIRGGTRLKRQVRGLPGIYFAHLGGEARRRSISILENLRQSGIPIHQGLCFERIGDQMTAARNLAVPYVLIMGHKEAMEGTVLVREVATNSQEAVPALELAAYLKRRRFAPFRSPEKV